jgi:hypothetical protein
LNDGDRKITVDRKADRNWHSPASGVKICRRTAFRLFGVIKETFDSRSSLFNQPGSIQHWTLQNGSCSFAARAAMPRHPDVILMF